MMAVISSIPLNLILTQIVLLCLYGCFQYLTNLISPHHYVLRIAHASKTKYFPTIPDINLVLPLLFRLG